MPEQRTPMFTGRFYATKPESGVLVRTSVGYPRGIRGPLENLPCIAPTEWWQNQTGETIPEL